MHKNKVNRRKFVVGLGIAGASQLPSKWTKPVIDNVMLPAHAQTSPEETTDTTTPAPLITNFRGDVSLLVQDARLDRPRNMLSIIIPDAVAQVGFTGDLCITSNDGESFEAKLLYEFDGEHYHEASGTVGGSAIPFTQTAGSAGCFIISANIEVSSIDASGASFVIGQGLGASGAIGAGSGCPTKPSEVCEMQ